MNAIGTNVMITTLIKKYRNKTISEVETIELFKIFKDREPAVLKFMKRANGLYESQDLLNAYYEGIIRAIGCRKKDGKWITDLRRKDTVVSKIWSHGMGFAKSFIHKNSQKKLVVVCEECGHLNGYHSEKCVKCKHKFGNEKLTFEKETNINKLITNDLDESKKFEYLSNDSFNDNNHVENKYDYNIFLNRIKYELKKRNLNNYLTIIDLMMNKEIIDSSNYLKEIGKRMKVSPQSVNAKIKKIKKILSKTSLSI